MAVMVVSVLVAAWQMKKALTCKVCLKEGALTQPSEAQHNINLKEAAPADANLVRSGSCPQMPPAQPVSLPRGP